MDIGTVRSDCQFPNSAGEPKAVMIFYTNCRDTHAALVGRRPKQLMTVGPDTTIVGMAPEEEEGFQGGQYEAQWQLAWDDVSGQALDAEQASLARQKEMQYIDRKGGLVRHPPIPSQE